MGTELLLNRVKDRPPTAAEAAQLLRSLYQRGATLVGVEHDGRPCAFVVAFWDVDDQYAPNFLTGEQAECEWWQRDHVLTGLAIGATEPEASWEALACAKRGHLSRANVTVWYERPSPFNQMRGHFRFFPRSARIPANNFRPASSELTTDELKAILQRSA